MVLTASSACWVSPRTSPKVDLLHRQMHQLATELCELQDQGHRDQALERLHELFGLRDQLLKALGVFID